MSARCIAALLMAVAAYAQSGAFSWKPRGEFSPSGLFAFSPDGAALLSVSPGRATLISTVDGASREVPSLAAAQPVAVAVAGNRLAVADAKGAILLQPVSTPVRWTQGRPEALAFSPDGAMLAIAGGERIVLSDLATGRELRSWTMKSSKGVRALAVTSASVIAITARGAIIEWASATGAQLRQIQDTAGTVHIAAFDPSGRYAALATESVSMSRGNPMREAHPSDISRDNRLRIYDLQSGTLAKEITGVAGQIRALSFSADSRFTAAIIEKQTSSVLTVFDAVRGAEVASLPAQHPRGRVAFSPDGGFFASIQPDGRLGLFATEGVMRGAAPGNLAGQKIRVTTADRTPLLRPAQRMVLAVMSFQAIGADAATGAAVADLLRNRLAGLPLVTLVERERIDAVLREQNLQNSDRFDSQTAVQLGRLMGAGKLLFGSVSKLEDTWTISAQLVDVSTGRIEGIREAQCERCRPSDLPETVNVLSAALAER